LLYKEKILEIDKGYRENYSSSAKNFYQNLYVKIPPRLLQKSIIRFGGRQYYDYDTFLNSVIISTRKRFSSISY